MAPVNSSIACDCSLPPTPSDKGLKGSGKCIHAFQRAVQAFAIYGLYSSAARLHHFLYPQHREGETALDSSKLRTAGAGVTTKQPLLYEGYRESQALNELADVTHSEFVEALVYEYDCTNPNKATSFEEILSNSFYALDLMETDGVPSAIPGHPYLYIGSVGAAYNRTTLQQEKITHILNMDANSVRPRFPDIIQYLSVYNLRDSENARIKHHFQATSDFIEEARQSGGRVLVHCWRGISRSATALIAYLITSHGMTRDDALTLVKSVRSVVEPNKGYMRQLLSYQHEVEAVNKKARVTTANRRGRPRRLTRRSRLRSHAGHPLHSLPEHGKAHTDKGSQDRIFLGKPDEVSMPYKKSFLSDIPFSALKQFLLSRCAVSPAASHVSSSSMRYNDLLMALQIMKMVEIDGQPIPLNGQPDLYTGSIGAACNSKALFVEGITKLASVTHDTGFNNSISEPYVSPSIVSTSNPYSIRVQYGKLLQAINNALEQDGAKVLVHGWRDRTTSVAVAVAYMMQYQGVECDEALSMFDPEIIRVTNVQCSSNFVKCAHQIHDASECLP